VDNRQRLEQKPFNDFPDYSKKRGGVYKGLFSKVFANILPLTDHTHGDGGTELLNFTKRRCSQLMGNPAL